MQDYKNYLKTNANSLSFSSYIAVLFLVAGTIDFIATFAGVVLHIRWASTQYDLSEWTLSDFLNGVTLPFLQSWGLGKTADLLFGAPIIMLFSYTKKYSASSKYVDIIIPLAGIIVCLLVLLEGGMIALQALMSKISI